MIQYLERKLLENRQLIPPIPDQHLIRKIAKHYSQGVQIAIITRGVTTINEFEKVLSEFMGVRSETRTRTHYDNRREHKPWVRDEEENGRRVEQGRAHDNETWSNTQHTIDDQISLEINQSRSRRQAVTKVTKVPLQYQQNKDSMVQMM